MNTDSVFDNSQNILTLKNTRIASSYTTNTAKLKKHMIVRWTLQALTSTDTLKKLSLNIDNIKSKNSWKNMKNSWNFMSSGVCVCA